MIFSYLVELPLAVVLQAAPSLELKLHLLANFRYSNPNTKDHNY